VSRRGDVEPMAGRRFEAAEEEEREEEEGEEEED
jgi:hypothetical protein